MLRYIGFLFAVSMALLRVLAPQASFGQSLQTIALANQSAPGTAGGNFQYFGEAIINDRGNVVVQAMLNGPPTPWNGEGIWSWTPASGLQAEVLAGTPAPGGGSQNFQNIFSPAMNNNGEIAFRATVGPVGNSSDGFWTTAGGAGLQKVAIVGEEAGTLGPEWLFSNVNLNYNYERPALNDDGRIAFIGQLSSTSPGVDSQHSVWNWTPSGGLELLARTGDVAPATGGAHHSFPYVTTINRQGTTVYTGLLEGPGVDFPNDTAIFGASPGGSPTLLAREGDPAPGVPGGNWENPDSVQLSDSGHLYFRAQLTTTASVYHQGFWSDRSGAWDAISKQGDPAPDMPGRIMRDYGWDLTVNTDERVAFSAWHVSSAVGAFDLVGGLFSEGRTGQLELIAQQGAQAPELEPGRTYFDVGGIALNDRGQLLYIGYTRGPNPFDPFRYALYVHDVDDQVKLIAAEGNYLDVDDGPGVDLRKIVGLYAAPRGGNEAGAINRLGQVIFNATFEDGTSGVFVSNLVAVPEPSFAAMLLLAALIAKSWVRLRAR